jgi:hypothetical protein
MAAESGAYAAASAGGRAAGAWGLAYSKHGDVRQGLSRTFINIRVFILMIKVLLA